MASKMEKIREQQKKKAEELAQREKEHGKNKPSVKADTTDFMDDLVNAIENGELSDVEESGPILDSMPEPEPASEVPKKETAKERTASTKPAEKIESESKSTQKEAEPQSISSMLLFQAKPETKSVHKSISLRPATMELTDKILKEHYNGLSFNDLVQQLIDIWVAENRKHYNI